MIQIGFVYQQKSELILVISKRESSTTTKTMISIAEVSLCVLQNMKGVVHFELLEHGRTKTTDGYYWQFDLLNEALHITFPALVNGKWLFPSTSM